MTIYNMNSKEFLKTLPNHIDNVALTEKEWKCVYRYMEEYSTYKNTFTEKEKETIKIDMKHILKNISLDDESRQLRHNIINKL